MNCRNQMRACLNGLFGSSFRLCYLYRAELRVLIFLSVHFVSIPVLSSTPLDGIIILSNSEASAFGSDVLCIHIDIYMYGSVPRLPDKSCARCVCQGGSLCYFIVSKPHYCFSTALFNLTATTARATIFFDCTHSDCCATLSDTQLLCQR